MQTTVPLDSGSASFENWPAAFHLVGGRKDYCGRRAEERGRFQLACSRGAAAPGAHTQKRLFAASAGYCQNPACSRELFDEADGKAFHVAEMAHVFAASSQGPRGRPYLSEAERGAFENLIVLCANCHTMVDKAPDAFPDAIMFGWKRDQARKLTALFGVEKFACRTETRAAIEPLLTENSIIFERYGPHVEAALDPESGAAERWKRKMLTRILPNNNRVLAIINANRAQLSAKERSTFELFRQHIDDLEAYHIEKIKEDAARFPPDMVRILED